VSLSSKVFQDSIKQWLDSRLNVIMVVSTLGLTTPSLTCSSQQRAPLILGKQLLRNAQCNKEGDSILLNQKQQLVTNPNNQLQQLKG
jgi:hypothetical protein